MSKQILVDAICKDEIRVVSIENNKIVQLEQDSIIKKRSKRNIYLGIITKIEPSLQAAFIEYGNEKRGFLSFSNILPHYYQIKDYDKESILELPPEELTNRYNIQDVIKNGQQLLLQITKEERGNKGVSFTTYITLASKYCILAPYSKNRALSKQVTDVEERKRLNSIINQIDAKKGGIILRKSAIGKNSKNILSNYKYLCKLWDDIQTRILNCSAPALISEHNDLIQKILCDFSEEDADVIIVDGSDYYKAIKERAKITLPYDKLPIRLYRRRKPILEHYKVEKQIGELYKNKVSLPSGGYIIISPTEALVSIDINSGKMTDGANVEETAYKTNLEAAYEIARQIELRGLSGLIVVDFIDMAKYKNCQLIKSAVEEAFNKFNSYVQISEISEFGLMELSKQRTKKSIFESSATTCFHCSGWGYLQSNESIFLRMLKAIYHQENSGNIQISTSQNMALFIFNSQYKRIKEIEEELNVKIGVTIDQSLPEGEFQVKKIRTGKDYNKINTKSETNETSKINSWIKSWLKRFFQ
ncbi:MAG: Rne/Rng family ribonuclease [Rickettsiaceae bacterium H1]|nr:Rne/Rng family ribonuclease [Rickettsiaceae bacterium H1]